MATGQTIAYRGEHHCATVPDTLDLAERADLALNGIGGIIDPALHHTMFFETHAYCRPPFMKHIWADTTCDPKLAESFPMMRIMSGSERYADVEAAQRAEILSRIEGGLYWNRADRDRPWRSQYMPTFAGARPQEDVAGVLATARMLRAILVWRELEDDPAWDKLIRGLVHGLKRIAIRHDDYAYYPDCRCGEAFNYPRSGYTSTDEPQSETEGGEGSVVCYHGHQIQALTRWYSMTGDEEALDLAARLTRFIMLPRFWGGVPDPEGRREGAAHTVSPRAPDQYGVAGAELGHWYTHFHARAIGMRGILEYARVAGDQRALEFVRRAYEYSLTLAIPRLGSINSFPALQIAFPPIGDKCEGCSLGDLVALAIRLTDAGMGDYWDDVDGFVRNHLVEQQLVDRVRIEEAISKAPPYLPDQRGQHPKQEALDNVVERMIGSYSCASTPAGAFMMPIGCCMGNGSQGLYYAWESSVREQGDSAQVNLLLNRAAHSLDVDSYLPYEGRVIIHNKSARRVAVRVPFWVARLQLQATVSGQSRLCTWAGNYAIFDDLRPGDQIYLHFPMLITTASYTVASRVPTHEQTFTCTFRGSTCVAITPPDGDPAAYPFYQRDHLLVTQAPVKTTTHFVPDRMIHRW